MPAIYDRYPYVEDWTSLSDAYRRSAQIDREEADGYDRDDPAYERAIASAQSFDALADLTAKALPIGTRVHHAGEQYAHAIQHGTATIVDVKVTRTRFIEYVVERDKPLMGRTTRHEWAESATLAATDSDTPTTTVDAPR